MRTPLLFKTYRVLTTVLEPAVIGLLYWRQRQGREDRTRLGERQGYPSRQRPRGHVIWVHGASIGETLSLLPVVERLTQRGLSVLVTSGTRTSAALIARRLPPGAVHQFVPVDVPRYIRRFLDHWKPDLVLMAESEIWPNTVLTLEERHIPLVMVNGRMSDRSFQRWQKLPGIIGALLERFALCLTQSPDDAMRLAHLGAPRVLVSGNLKFDSAPPPADPRIVAHLSGLIAGRPVWLAASTHPGEENAIVAVHRALAQRHPQLLTIIAPRHPHRGPEVAAIAERAGLRASQRSRGIHPDRATDVYVADTVGEMGLFFRLSPIVLMGGTLAPIGGHNPIEPAKLGAAILHGPHIHSAREIYEALDEARGALLVKDSSSLARAASELLSNASLARDMARNASDTVQALSGAVDRTMQSIEPFIVQAKLGARR
ncbi:3-deoxy-D-manno-octulosonic acid transferase [Microvirga terricola]|uniref:3-deoxy-D-manno-octulosonic acid transferase n=1 Tax=Microvirga terricola TaxID=2719797 RepID=A0ABX0V9X3_9HYPH|nr:3-deoxy-D-manno-octulosonic acid transferase [Microvirga terricola]NIX76644.1 3-deoxy-D-manno-octulosonic acid transferase [Microvirga terricola]